MNRLVEKINFGYGDMYVYGEADFEANQVMQEPLEKLFKFEKTEEENHWRYFIKLNNSNDFVADCEVLSEGLPLCGGDFTVAKCFLRIEELIEWVKENTFLENEDYHIECYII